MEIQINNDFLLSFVSKYQDNAAKAIKYLAVLGVHFLETIHREDLPFKQLQELAKSFSQPKPEPETPFNKELQVIKDELANLNKKIDSRLGSPTSVKQSEGLDKPPTLPKTNEAIQQQPTVPPKKFAGPGAKFDSKGLTHKPPTAWREGDKRAVRSRYAEQLENIETNEQPRSRVSPANRSVERRDASLGSSKGDYYITPKPTEIVLPTVDLKESKNKVTRHHLDDTEAKRIMNEEGVIFFPKVEKEEVPKTVTKPRKEQTLEEVLRKEQQPLGESPFFGRERPTQPIEDSFNAEWSDVTESSQNFNQFSKPRFPQPRETLATKLFSAANVMQQQQGNKENYRPPQNRQEVRQSREEVRIQSQPDFSKKNQTRPQPNETSKRSSSKNRNSVAQLRQSTSREYGHVSSKIKDEVNYHKELSKQYKKMKQNMSQSEGFSDDFVLSNSTRFDPVREPERPRNLDMDTAAWGRSPYQSEEVGQARTPKLMESDSTLMKSSLTVQQLSAANPADSRRPVENTRPQQTRFEDFERSEDENMYRSRAENRGGMLDIANSFLNSPLMQHITNEKNYDTSFKDSMGYSIQNRNPSRFGNYASNQDFGESNAYMQSRSGNFGTEEDMKLQSSYGLQQSKYSNAGNNAYNSERVGGRTGHNLKDSTNRRFQENMNNELAASYNKEGVSSLASSNFSNFLNDEMKGFYQKERLDLKKPKNSDLIMRFGSSVTSDSQSLQGGEPINFLKPEKKSQFYKNEYGDNLDNTNNKTFDGFSFDNANVFKDERMSVTQILNN